MFSSGARHEADGADGVLHTLLVGLLRLLGPRGVCVSGGFLHDHFIEFLVHRIVVLLGSGHAGDAEEVGGADVERLEDISRVVGINDGHFADGVSGGADPDQGGEQLLRLGSLGLDGLALLDLSVQLGDLVVRGSRPGLVGGLGVEDAGSDNVPAVLGSAASEVDTSRTPDLNSVITALMCFKQVK